MITNWLLDHPWATTAGLVTLLVAGPLVAAGLAGRPRAAWWLAALALVPVAVLTLSPGPGTVEDVRCTVQWALPTLTRVELLANVLLFVPPTLLATVASRCPWPVLLAGSGLSAAVEALQAVVPGIGRACDTTDWSSNTLGAAAGVGLAVLGLTLRRAVRAPSRH
ncbi:VanZ family protein [Klenkia brasiliensis]|uniref:VanZ like family protein n=1 Tax=Klenkia brasiliensis TaxID=333142 RepID=A0A1G7SG98_9ACTN|nr:VanZ family protein [Klenkia brasiliensis]SDG22107.1 VanZ like family protein [Klenkia brasiliensis]